MALWTDVIDPATLTGYARASLEEREQAKGSLADYLPNKTVGDIAVRVVQGDNGLVDAANFRAYDAELEKGKTVGGKRSMIELPALGQEIPVSEYDQLRARNASDDEMLKAVLATTDRVVTAIANRMEYMRGVVLATGKATIDQENFKTSDDFGRDAAMNVTAGTLWTDAAAKPLDDLTAYVDAYIEANGEAPGTILTSQKVLRLLTSNGQFAATLTGGATIPSSVQDLQNRLASFDLPQVRTYTRKVRADGETVNVLPDDSIFLLPAAGESALGASYWGRTLTSTELSWGIASADQSGIVAGVTANDKPPYIKQVFGDAIGLPILANANLAFKAKVV